MAGQRKPPVTYWTNQLTAILRCRLAEQAYGVRYRARKVSKPGQKEWWICEPDPTVK